jgi:hypothetical protein
VPETLRTDPVWVGLDDLDTAIVEILDAEAAVTVVALHVKTIFEGLPALLIFDQLFQGQTVEHVGLAWVSVIDFDPVDLSRLRVDNSMPLAVKVALGEDHVALDLLAMMAEVHVIHLMPVLNLHAL